MRILLTRPREDSERTAEFLRDRGHTVLISPLMEIRLFDGPDLSLNDVQAVLATSINGVRAFVRRSPRRDIPVFAIGPQTALAARAAGFVTVRDADGDAAALATVVAQSVRAENGALFYAAGREQRGDLARALEEKGFSVRSEILYEAFSVPALSAETAAALGDGKIDAIILYSPKSAGAFAAAIERMGLADRCLAVTAVCLSEAVAEAAAPLRFAAIRITKRPNQDSVLSLLEEVANR